MFYRLAAYERTDGRTRYFGELRHVLLDQTVQNVVHSLHRRTCSSQFTQYIICIYVDYIT
jgi:hypothetical protein